MAADGSATAADAPPTTLVAPTARAAAIVRGFTITRMAIRDAESGEVLWRSTTPWDHSMFSEEKDAHLPASILDCAAVAREVEFSSVEIINDFRMMQRILVCGTCIEEWPFEFGFIMPGSTNSFEQTIVAAKKEHMLPASVLSGNLVIETSFFSGDELIGRAVVRVYYD